MFGNIFKASVVYTGTLQQALRVEEWADSMMCTTAVSQLKVGSIIKVYGYKNGSVSHIVVNSNKSIGKSYGLCTDVKFIVSKCKKMK